MATWYFLLLVIYRFTVFTVALGLASRKPSKNLLKEWCATRLCRLLPLMLLLVLHVGLCLAVTALTTATSTFQAPFFFVSCSDTISLLALENGLSKEKWFGNPQAVRIEDFCHAVVSGGEWLGVLRSQILNLIVMLSAKCCSCPMWSLSSLYTPQNPKCELQILTRLVK